MPSYNPLILALDTPSPLKALNLVRRLKVTGIAFKVGFELFTAGGPRIVEKIVSHDVRVFLDLKFHDIPNTVARASEVATKMGVWMFNVHASGGSRMMKSAKDASLAAASQSGMKVPLITAVTVLTSMDSLDELNIGLSVEDQVVHLAGLAKKSGLDGVVCSAREAVAIRKKCGPDFCLVTPGIRTSNDPADDQKRTVTPIQALKNGSNYLVMGRSLLSSGSPLKQVDLVLAMTKV